MNVSPSLSSHGDDTVTWASAWLCAALVVGAVVAADPSGQSPFGPIKWMVVSTLALGTAGAGLVAGSAPIHRPSAKAWVVLLALLTLAMTFGGDVPTALFGHPDRHLGLLTWAMFGLLYLAGQQLTSAARQRLLTRAAVVAVVWLGAYSMWEAIAGPPIAIATTTSRLTGPFGSAAYLGAACCLLAPIAIGVACSTDESRSWRVAALIGAALGSVAMIGSGARAAWVGAVVGIVTLIIRRRPSRRHLLVAIAALAVALAASAPWWSTLTERTAGAGSRLDDWAVASRVIVEHPVLGVGPEGYRIAAPEGIDRHYERTYGRDRVLPDRAHSGPLDLALVGGVPAALVGCLLIAFVCRRAWRCVRHSGSAQAGVAIGLIAYAVQQLLLFPIAEVDPLWWLFAGMIVASTNPRPAVAGPVVRPGASARRLRRSIGFVALVCAPVALAAGALDVAADRLAERALAATASTATATGPISASAFASAIADAERAVALRPDSARYRLFAIEVRARRGTLADVDAALGQAQRALDWSADDPIALDARATLLLQRATITGTADDAATSLRAWQQLVRRDPLRARWQLQVGRAAALGGDRAAARAAWVIAADLSPDDLTAPELIAALDAQ